MLSKSLAIAALAAGCVAAAAGGAYLAVRHNATYEPVAVAATAPPADSIGRPTETPKPVAETEALVSSPAPSASKPEIEAAKPVGGKPEADKSTPEKTARSSARNQASRSGRVASAPAAPRPAASVPEAVPAEREPVPAAQRETREPVAEPPVVTPAPANIPARTEAAPQPATEVAPPPPQLEQLVVPASSVIGLRVETPLSTDRARVEDRVEARVTRDVMVDGRVAIPSGARAVGSVILVERGGKMKDRARLGVRFHTLALADGSELPINTEPIYREGDSPSGESARKIGGAAVGGAILGALIGGKKGAVVGGATGAAGGTAVVMAGDRNAATLPTGTIVTIRLAAPAGVEVEKR